MSKKLYLVILFLTLNFGFCQNFDSNWKKVYQYELDGKIESAKKEVESIYKKSNRKNDDTTVIKCFFYLSKFEQVFDENAQSTIITNLQLEIKRASKENKALFYYIYAKILINYQNANWYQINNRTNLENNKTSNFLTWTTTDFSKEINHCYEEILKNKSELRSTTIDNYNDVFDYSPNVNAKNFTLYDFLYEKTIDFYETNIYWNRDVKDGTLLLTEKFYAKPSEFAKMKIENKEHIDIIPIFEILQEHEKYLIQTKQLDKLDIAYYKRLNFAYKKSHDALSHQKKLFELEKTTQNQLLKQELKVERARQYTYFNSNSKNNEKQKALHLIDSIFASKINVNALAQAERLRNEIIKKSITVELNKIIYPYENTRAFVNYKNVDSIKINYYKFPVALNEYLSKYRNGKYVDSDSLVLDFIAKNKAFKSYTRTLPKRKDYNNHTTEILLEPIETGNYLVFIESDNYTQFKEAAQKAFSYEIVKSTQFIVIEDDDEKNNIIYLYDRKTGKPIENTIINNDVGKYTSNKNGKVFLKKTKYLNDKYNNTITIIKDKDTLIQNYNRNYLREKPSPNKDDSYDSYDAKAMVFFDRAIYRPGQKMYYKGVIIQKKDDVKSVVPFLTIHVIINDANHNVLKEFDVQTNQFGSFSGEFDIPKNSLTGRFYIEIVEPDEYEQNKKYYNKKEDEHSFWDNVDYNDSQDFSFQVEEYKRPTFEVKFNEIKENYTIGDSLQIVGNAKALAGNILTNAKVSYTVSRDYSKTGYYWKSDNNYINTETFTDSEGNFTIPIAAIIDSTSNDKIDNIRFIINASFTDTNGETRTTSQTVNVNQKTLKLDIVSNNKIYVEDKVSVNISSTTYNNFPIDAKGELKIYEIKSKKYLKQRAFGFPEIQEINRAQFEILFPNEPYDYKDIETKRVLVNTVSFDTKIGKEVRLEFLKNAVLGNYEIEISAFDSKNNLIIDNHGFQLASKKRPFSETQLFTYSDISKKENNYFEIEIQSVIPNLYITHRYYADQSDLQEEITQQLVNGRTIFKIKKEEEYKNNINFHFSSFWENQSYEQRYSINKEQIQTNLNIEVTSLRNKIEPGSIENWSFKIGNSKFEAEVLASMYDSSLDQFAVQNWTNAYFNNNGNYYNAPQIYLSNNNSTIYFNNFYLPQKYFVNYKRNPEIYWFGFNFNDFKNTQVLRDYQSKINATASIPKNAKTISGIVSDELGTLAGATIVVKGTSRGTTTNFDGEFTIVASKDEILEISFPGKKKTTITVENIRNHNVFIEEGFVGDEVVVTAYGAMRKESVTGSISVVSSELDESNDFNYYRGNLYRDGDSESKFKSLSGRVAGLEVKYDTLSNGKTIRFRGISSLNNTESPLYVIDGILFNGEVANINAQDIESMTFLKDAAASALYGNRAANGVIIIITKNAIQDLGNVKTRTNFNETAFFYPNLKTDTNGNISFEFTTPESLTKWKLRLFAHNKNAEVGQFESEIISQKDVMVQTNMPRFVREKDQIKISAKVVNMTLETKSGIAMLQLFDASTNKVIDEICANKNNVKNFSCKAKESVPVEWLINIPEGLHGLQYKIVAKSGNFSDGEENILPVLSNKVLLTESIPIWVKGETKKEYEFTTLKNNTSSTLKNHLFTLEYTSNPTWLALHSLPYLMEYEHECAEQTFSRYYANYVATQIIDSNPKVASLFETWKKEGKSTSKLNMNEELKSIILAESPWLLDNQDEELKNKQLALLMDLNTMKESMETTLKKLKEKQKSSGSFSWFDGGDDNEYITQHIVKGLGHLGKLFPEKDSIYASISDKAIPYLDQKYISNSTLKNQRINYYTYSNLHYLYARSFYVEKHPLSKKIDSIINIQKVEFKKDWLTYNLYSKALLALTMNRFGDKAFAKKILINLKETAARNEYNGMYWIENTNGYYWYQSSIETQAMLIEAFAEIVDDDKIVDELKVWLLKNKQVNKWSTTKATTEAIYALLLQGSDWTSIKDNSKFSIGNEKVLTKKLSEKDKEATTGYIKLNWKAEEITNEMATIKVENKSKAPGYGGVYWQYFENLENIKTDSTNTMYITKTLFKKVKTSKGNELMELNKETLKTGDLITIRLVLKTENDLEFVHLKDLRASCFEPVDVLSNYEWRDNLSYYRSTKDVATHFFFDKINKGTYVLEYDVRINNTGNFNDGIATLQSMYAPEFSAHSTNTIVKVD
ncbi:alpha-2-macroglobulin family protein [uncultured Flavobacterium sp.]|uniref:alpha-2-macroglobulin family protein n=1 Tax=uncultured Flavobacterium sp. TaxID=165435 RepID=UPI0030C822F9